MVGAGELIEVEDAAIGFGLPSHDRTTAENPISDQKQVHFNVPENCKEFNANDDSNIPWLNR